MLPDKLFLPLEEDLKQKIYAGEAPFLGLFADNFPSARRNFIFKAIKRSSSPIEAYIDGLQDFPALLSTYLVIHLVEGFGRSGYFEVYPIISAPLGVESIPESQKKKLWKAFRKACVRLGLSVSPRISGAHYMVEEYLRQAGFPINFADRLTLKMISYTNEVGIPDEDDPDSIQLWQQGLLERLNSQFPKVAKEAMERDEKGYYAQLFVQLVKGNESSSKIGDIIAKTIKEGPQTKTLRKIAIPQIIFKDFEMGILVPGGRENQWQVNIDGEVRRYASSYIEDHFIPFESELPFSAEITEINSGVKWKYPLWKDEKNNRVLVFSMPSGRLSRNVSISDGEVCLDPGEYLLVLRFEPENDEGEIEQLSEEPSLYIKSVVLSPGKIFIFRRGPAKLYLKTNDVPALNWLGDSVRGVRGNVFYPSKDLKVEVTIPEEFLEFHDHSFTLIFKSPVLGDDIEVPVTGGKNIIDLYPYLSDWKPGVGRLLAELHRKNSRRSLVRNSVTLWHGLKFVKDRIEFVCDTLPENRFEDGCQNLKIIEDEKIITYKDDTTRFFKMAFQDERRVNYFTWAVPGIFLSLESYKNGNVAERALKKGTTLAISPTVRNVLKIYATNPATLKIGDFETRSNFTRLGSKRIPLASLLEYIRPEDNALYFQNEITGVETPLVYLVSPHEVFNFSVEPHLNSRKIRFRLVDKTEAVRISAKNLLDGTESHTELNSYDSFQYDVLDFTFGGKAHVFSNANNEYDIDISLDNWQPGLWLLEFEVKLHGRWGALTNERNDIYADGLIISDVGKIGTFKEVLTNFEGNDEEKEYYNAFERLHKALLHPYAKESWQKIYWIEKVWKELHFRLARDYDNETWMNLLSLSTKRPPEIASEDWIPARHIGAYLPQLYCLHRNEYAKIRKQSNILLNCLSFFPRLNNLLRIYSNNDFDTSSLMGFSNAFEVHSQNASPKQFNMSNYRQALTSRDLSERWRLLNDDEWHPVRGDYLGPMHYRYALMTLKEAYHNSLSAASSRRGRLLNLVRRMSSERIDKYVADDCFRQFAGKTDLGLFDYDEQPTDIIDEEKAQEREHLDNIIRFVSLFAQICRCEARYKGVLDNFLSDIRQQLDDDLNAADLRKTFCYLLYLCEDVFAFYLLLWELIFTTDCDAGR